MRREIGAGSRVRSEEGGERRRKGVRVRVQHMRVWRDDEPNCRSRREIERERRTVVVSHARAES